MDTVDNSDAAGKSSNETNNTLDAIPSSSTDADVKHSNADLTNEEAISSTSAEPETSKTSFASKFGDGFSASDINFIIMGQSSSKSDPKTSSLEAEADFLDLNISDVPTEKITEDVEDIVQDLENLLGESTDDFRIDHSKYRKTSDTSSVKQNTSKVEDLNKRNQVQQCSSSNLKTEPTSTLEHENLIKNIEKVDNLECKLESAVESEKTQEITKVSENVSTKCESTEESSENEQNAVLSSNITDAAATHSKIISEENAVKENVDSEIETTQETSKNLISEETSNQKIEDAPSSVDGSNINQEDLSIYTEEKMDVDESENIEQFFDAEQDNNFPKSEEIATLQLEKVPESEEIKTTVEDEKKEVVADVSESIVNKEEVKEETEELSKTEQDVEDIKLVESSEQIVEEDTEKKSIESCETKKSDETVEEKEEESVVPCEDIEDVEMASQEEQMPEDVKEEEMEVDNSKINEESLVESESEEVNKENLLLNVAENTNQESLEQKVNELEFDESEKILKTEEQIQDDLTTQAVQSIMNYEFGESTISSSGSMSIESQPFNENISSHSSTYIDHVPVSSSNLVESSIPDNTEKLESNITQNLNEESETKAFEETKHELVSEETKQVLVSENTKLPLNSETPHNIDSQESLPKTKNSSISTPLMISVENVEHISAITDENKCETEKEERGPLKMTITKQSDSTHSILKIFDPDDANIHSYSESKTTEQHSVPKLIIKPVASRHNLDDEITEQSVPKITIKPIPQQSNSPSECSKQYYTSATISPRMSSKSSSKQESHSPIKLTIRPQLKNEDMHKQQHISPKLTVRPVTPSVSETGHHSPRITIKPIVRSPEEEQMHSPRVTIKPIVKPDDLIVRPVEQQHSPRITIKPIVKPEETIEQLHSPKITIKPIVKPEESGEILSNPRITIKPVVRTSEDSVQNPRITIKPIMKPAEQPDVTITEIPGTESDSNDETSVVKCETISSPKITIKPIVKPHSINPDIMEPIDYDDQIKQERIVLKIHKNTIPGSKDSIRKHMNEDSDRNEKLAKIKLKFSKEGGHAHIVPQERMFSDVTIKRSVDDGEYSETPHKRLKTSGGTEQFQSKLKQILSNAFGSHANVSERLETGEIQSGDLSIIPATAADSQMNKSGVSISKFDDMKDPLSDIPVFEITPETVATMCKNSTISTEITAGTTSEATLLTAAPVVPPPPRKRGRPRKVPLVVREEFKDPKEEAVQQQPVPVPYDSGRPKRSCRGPSVRTTLGIKPRKPRGPGRGRGGKRGMGTRGVAKPPKEPKLSAAKLKLLKAFKDSEKEGELKDAEFKQIDNSEVVIYEEETRMSADTNSRAQTPAKQVLSSSGDIDESQSSFQSSATTESVKVRRGPRLEVHQEPEGAVISAEQLAEYSWGGGGPYMLQEQVAQFLGIKSFKRKYPGIKRRPVDMQERDFIRESGLASEAMCDLGLTAVNSSDILDIMYTDFQHKYEEYCKHQRDRQAKDLTNKQRALSLAAKQESNKLDITEQAVQSAANWNSSFNKARREQRKACMDLQTFTIQYPKGKMKQINRGKIGNYPLALVPGQYTDWFKTFTPTELNNLPLNTMCYDPININNNIIMNEMDDSQSDCSMSDSDSSSSDSDSSDSGSSATEDCNMCSPQAPTLKKVPTA